MATLRKAAYVAFFASLVRANIDADGSFTIGDNAPFGLPDSSFRPSSQANATGSFSILALNTSNPKEPLNFDGKLWTVGISLQADIPLNGSTDKNLSAAEKKQFTQFVSMSISNVDKNEAANLTSDSTMCGHIMFSLRSNATADNQDDAGKGGNCDFLSQQCQKDLQELVKSGSSDCNSIIVPNSCEEWLDPSSSGDGTSQMNSTSFGRSIALSHREEERRANAFKNLPRSCLLAADFLQWAWNRRRATTKQNMMRQLETFGLYSSRGATYPARSMSPMQRCVACVPTMSPVAAEIPTHQTKQAMGTVEMAIIRVPPALILYPISGPRCCWRFPPLILCFYKLEHLLAPVQESRRLLWPSTETIAATLEGEQTVYIICSLIFPCNSLISSEH